MIKILSQAKKSFANYYVAKVITTKTPRISAATRFKTSHKRDSSLSGLSNYNLTGYIFALLSSPLRSLIRSSLRSPDVSPITSKLVCIHATPPWDTVPFASGLNGINLNIRESIVSIFSTSVTKLLSLIIAAFLIVSCAAGVVGVGDGVDDVDGPDVTSGPGSSGTTLSDIVALGLIRYTTPETGNAVSSQCEKTNLPRLPLNRVEIKRRVAARLGITTEEGIKALTEGTDFTIDVSIAGELRSDERRHFKVEQDPTNPDLIVLSICGNALGITRTEIFALIGGSLTVDVEVNVPKANSGNGATIPASITVELSTGEPLDLSKALSFNVETVTGEATKGPIPSPTAVLLTGVLKGTINGDTPLNATPPFGFSDRWTVSGAIPASFTAGNPPSTSSGGTFPAPGTPGNIFQKSDLVNTQDASDTNDDILAENITVAVEFRNPNNINELFARGNFTFAKGTDLTTLNSASTVVDSFLNNLGAVTNGGIPIPFLFKSENNMQLLNLTVAWTIEYTYTRQLQAPAPTIPGNINLTQVQGINENTPAASPIALPRGPSVLSAFGLKFEDPNPPKGQPRTVFFALGNHDEAITAVNNECDVGIVHAMSSVQGFVYYDNSDNRIKVSTSFDNEKDDFAPYADCYLAVSVDGENYKWVGLPVATTTTTPIVGENVLPIDLTSDNVAIASSVATCEGATPTYDCYYAFVNMTIDDVDEAPEISLAGAATNFAGSFETVVPSSGTPARGTVPPADPLQDSVQLEIKDPDSRTGLSLLIDENKIKTSYPSLFSLKTDVTDNLMFNLVVDRAELDYETFPGTLVDGKAIYKIEITATDSNGKSATESFDYEVRDVIYPPVLTQAPDSGFVKEDGILNGTNGEPLYLLSGLQALINDSQRLGTFSAEDPETNSAADIVYAYDGAFDASGTRLPNISPNFALLDVAGSDSVRLIISAAGLAEKNAANLRILAVNRKLLSSPPAGNSRIIIDPSVIPSGAALETNVSVEVNSSKYTDLSSSLAADAFKFKSSALSANVSEVEVTGTPSPVVIIDPTTKLRSNVQTLNQYLATTAFSGRKARFTVVSASNINNLIPEAVRNDLSGLNIKFADAIDLFAVNPDTGAITVQVNADIIFEENPRLVLPVSVTNVSATTLDTAGDPSFDDLKSADIILVSIVVQDTNTAPVLADYTVVSPATSSDDEDILDTATQVNLTIAENVATAGTELLRFTVDDDNDKKRADFLADARIIDGTFSLSYEEVDGTVVGVVSLASSLDYETQSSNMSTITVTDQGTYSYNSTSGDTMPASVIANRVTASTNFTLNLAVTDSVEVPVIAAADKQGNVSENDAIGTVIRGLDLSLMNINDFGGAINPAEFDFTIGGEPSLSDIFDATIDAAGQIQIIVKDANKLEDLGDGDQFALSLELTYSKLPPINSTATTRGSKLTSNKIDNIIVLVEDVAPVIRNFASFSNGGSIAIKPINEADVAGMGDNTFILQNNTTKNFVLKIADFVTDDDDNDLRFSITAQNVANKGNLASPGLVNPTIVELVDNPDTTAGGTVIRLVDTDFIDANLFGDLDFTITLVDARPASIINTAANRNATISVSVTAASPKNLNLGDPFNTVSYTQSDYADPFTLNATEEAALSSKIVDYNSAAVNSSTVKEGEIIRLSDAKLYNTTYIPSDTVNLTDGGTFIARDTKKLSPFTVTIPVTSASSIAAVALDVLDEANFQVLVERDGKLIVAPADFNKYFAVTFNNTVNSVSNSKQIIITQRVATRPAVVDNPTTPEDESSPAVSYQLLDTIPLFPDGKESTQLNFFIRAINNTAGGGNDASEYDLAQFNVEVEAASTNEPTVISRIALVPSGTTVPDAPTSSPKADLDALFGITDAILATKDASGNWQLAIPENGIISGATNLAVNNFASGYKLVVEFSNPDAVEENEAVSKIATALAAGSATGIDTKDPTNNIADNGNLLAIQSASDADSNTPGGGASFANDSPAHAAGQNYTLSYDFALAQNLAGAASITFAVDDIEQVTNEVLSTTTATLTINVMPIARDTSTDVAVNTISLGVAPITPLVVTTPPSFTEDTAPLPATGGGNVALTSSTSDTSNIQRSAQVNLVSVDNTAGQVGHNPLDKEFITRVDRETIQYVAHGWGSQQLNFGIEYTESRGFAANVAPVNTKTVSYPAVGTGTNNVVANRMVKVTNENDATTYGGPSSLDSIAASQFTSSTATAQGGTADVTFMDNDLLFDTVDNVFGTVSTAPSNTDSKAPTLDIPGNRPVVLATGVTAGTTNTAQASISYTISITSLQAKGTSESTYKLTFGFSSPTAADLLDAATVGFVESKNDPTIVDSSTDALVFPTDGTDGVATSIEGNAVDVRIAELAINDLDLGKTTNPSTLTYSITTGDDLVKWQFPSQTGGDAVFINRLQLAKELQDADVATHRIEWQIADDRASKPIPLTGSFMLTVTGVDDPPTALITANAPGVDTPLNVNTGAGGITVDLTITDPDFTEKVPLVTVADLTYDDVTFTLDAPTDASSPTNTCEVTGTSRKIYGDAFDFSTGAYDSTAGTFTIATPSPLFAGTNQLTTSDIQAATGCGSNEIKIGTKITASQFTNLVVTDDRGTGTSSSDVAPAAAATLTQGYVFQGYRTNAPTAQDISKVAIAPGASGVINFIVTDGDPDDGTAHDPTPSGNSNIVRTTGGPAAAWDKTGSSITATPATGGSCTGVTISTIGVYADYTTTANTDDSVAMIPYTTEASASGTCVITIMDSGEDGQAVSKTATIRFEVAPTIGAIMSNVGDTIDTVAKYGSNFMISNLVTDNDNDNDGASTNGATINYAVDSSSAGICSIDPNDASPTLSFTAHTGDQAVTFPRTSVEVTPLKPGVCNIDITVAENGVSSMEQTTVTLAEIAPSVALTVDGVAATPDNSGNINPIISRKVFKGEFIPVVLNIANQDPGDGTHVVVKVTNNNPECTITTNSVIITAGSTPSSIINSDYAATAIGASVTNSYEIRSANSDTTTNTDCDGDFVFEIYEDGATNQNVRLTLTANAANGFTFQAGDIAPTIAVEGEDILFYPSTRGINDANLLDATTIGYGATDNYRVGFNVSLTDTDVLRGVPARDDIVVTYDLSGSCIFASDQITIITHSSTINRISSTTATVTIPGVAKNATRNIASITTAVVRFTSPGLCTATVTNIEEGGQFTDLTTTTPTNTIAAPEKAPSIAVTVVGGTTDIRDDQGIQLDIQITNNDPGDEASGSFRIVRNATSACEIREIGSFSMAQSVAFAYDSANLNATSRTTLYLVPNVGGTNDCGGVSFKFIVAEPRAFRFTGITSIATANYSFRPQNVAPLVKRVEVNATNTDIDAFDSINSTGTYFGKSFTAYAYIAETDDVIGGTTADTNDEIVVTFRTTTSDVCDFGGDATSAFTIPAGDAVNGYDVPYLYFHLASAEVNIKKSGGCTITASAVEGGKTSNEETYRDDFPYTSPTLIVVTTGASAGNTATAVVTANLTAPGQAVYSLQPITNTNSECTITPNRSGDLSILGGTGGTALGNTVELVRYGVMHSDMINGGSCSFTTGILIDVQSPQNLVSHPITVNFSPTTRPVAIISQPTAAVAIQNKQQNSTVTVTARNVLNGRLIINDYNSGCKAQPNGTIDITTEGLFSQDIVITQRDGSVGELNCKDVSEFGTGPIDTSINMINIRVEESTGIVVAMESWADTSTELSQFKAPAVTLSMLTPLLNVPFYSLEAEVPIATADFAKYDSEAGSDDASKGDMISGNHIYRYLERRRWFFGTKNRRKTTDDFRDSVIFGNQALLTPILSNNDNFNLWNSMYYRDGYRRVSDLFFIDVNNITTHLNSLTSPTDGTLFSQDTEDDPTMAQAGYTAEFFKNIIKPYNVNGYLKFTNSEFTVNYQREGNEDNQNQGYFTRAVATSTYSGASSLIRIQTDVATDLLLKGCRIAYSNMNLELPGYLRGQTGPADELTRSSGANANILQRGLEVENLPGVFVDVKAGGSGDVNLRSCEDHPNQDQLSAGNLSKIVSFGDGWERGKAALPAPNGMVIDNDDATNICQLEAGGYIGGGGMALPIISSLDTAGINFTCRFGNVRTSGDADKRGPFGDGNPAIIKHRLGANSAVRLNVQHHLGNSDGVADSSRLENLVYQGKALYMLEAYPVSSADNTQLLGKPIRILFEVETR